eukprot:scaffold21327_cov66-Phaeocystis_antarctica.AAC.5
MHCTPAATGDSEREVAPATDSTHSYVLPPFLSVIDVGWTLRHWHCCSTTTRAMHGGMVSEHPSQMGCHMPSQRTAPHS